MGHSDEATLSRERKVNLLLEREADDARRIALDAIDEQARATHTWGSPEHRHARDQRERAYDAQRAAFEKMSDQQLDQALGIPAS